MFVWVCVWLSDKQCQYDEDNYDAPKDDNVEEENEQKEFYHPLVPLHILTTSSHLIFSYIE